MRVGYIHLLAAIIASLLAPLFCSGGNAEPFLKKGWAALIKDNDTAAIENFELAYEAAIKEKDIEHTAEALLNLGICYYGVSQAKGLEYCFSAMTWYKKLEQSDPSKALYGRSRCLQLVSTVNSRQGKFREAIRLSREALKGFGEKDSSGTLGLAYASIGSAYSKLKMPDSSEYYHRKALAAQLLVHNFTYLPAAYVKIADLELAKGNSAQSEALYRRAGYISDSTENLQAQVTSLLGLSRWHLAYARKDSVEFYMLRAKQIASQLRDKAFYLKTLGQLLDLKTQNGQFEEALHYRDEIAATSDSMYSFDKQKLAKSLEVQFNTAEKDRRLQLLQRENEVTRLSNYLLWSAIVMILLAAAGSILFLRRINARDRLVLQTREELIRVQEEQKRIREKFLQNELEFKESQLSAMALQMLQKNELMQEMKEQLGGDEKASANKELNRLIGKGLNHDKDWADFNTSFESVNRNFYARLKQNYPEISPNDLKICAMIKLNLSTKDMAGILNISPDSVKTARYRLRKKLQLTGEDNLTEFILKL